MEILQNYGNMVLHFVIETMTKIHGHMVSLALYLDVSLFAVYVPPWLLLGFIGAIIYKIFAGGPANPFGKERIEKVMFWIFVFTGLAGLIIVIFDIVMHARTKKKIRRETENDEAKDLQASKFFDSQIPTLTDTMIRDIRKSGF